MSILRKRTSRDGAEKSMSSPEVSPANLLARPARDEEQKMIASSGRTCCELLKRSDPLGSLLKMLVESERVYSPARVLRWRLEPIYSERRTYERNVYTKDTSSLKSSTRLNQQDIQSNRSLFRLAVLEPPTDEIGSSLSQDEMMLPTPTTSNALECCGLPGNNGHFEKNPKTGKMYLVRDSGWSYTPTLNGLASQGLRPTPTCNDSTNQTLPPSPKNRCDSIVKRILQKNDGQGFRLNPLYTEEMMGFPFLWTTLPFLWVDGAEKVSKRTATRSCHK